MATFDKKISNLLQSQLPDFVVEDHPKFLQFCKSYFQFLESAELRLQDIQETEGILFEQEDGNLLINASRIGSERTLIDSGDKIITEESVYGSFVNGETIVGRDSNARAVILAEDTNANKLFISAQNRFSPGELITGQTSQASARISSYRINPVQTIEELTRLRDPDSVIEDFLNNFRDEFLATLPETLAAGVNRKTLIKNVNSLYQLKGTAEGHRIFFRLLFNVSSETLYPREGILKVSAGVWDTANVMRGILIQGNGGLLSGRTLRGRTSGATILVESAFEFSIGGQTVVEFEVDLDSQDGTFQTGETLEGFESDTSINPIRVRLTNIPTGVDLDKTGRFYTTGDTVEVSGGGQGASVRILRTTMGDINSVYLSNAGSGYEVGDELVFDNTGTGGSGAAGFVSQTNGGIQLEGDEGGVIMLESFTTVGDSYAGEFLFQESGTGNGDITGTVITNRGSNYMSLPSVTFSSNGGVGAIVSAYSSNIGQIEEIRIEQLGIEHEDSPTPPELIFQPKLRLVRANGNFTRGELVEGLVEGWTGEVLRYDADTGLLELHNITGEIPEYRVDDTTNTEPDGEFFGVREPIQGRDSGATAFVIEAYTATATLEIANIGTTDGQYLNQDNHISERTVRIQDSRLYQDFSYVIRAGRSINDWRDSFKKTMHTSGFYLASEVRISNSIAATVFAVGGAYGRGGIVPGVNPGVPGGVPVAPGVPPGGTPGTPTPGVPTPPVFTPPGGAPQTPGQTPAPTPLFRLAFENMVGRRLGTENDGTIQRSNPLESVVPLSFRGRIKEAFDENGNKTRDVTIESEVTIPQVFTRIRDTFPDGTPITGGFKVASTRYNTLNRMANTAFQVDGNTFEQFGDIPIVNTDSNKDGDESIFQITSNFSLNRRLGTNVGIPSEITNNNLNFGSDSQGVTTDDDDFTYDQDGVRI